MVSTESYNEGREFVPFVAGQIYDDSPMTVLSFGAKEDLSQYGVLVVRDLGDKRQVRLPKSEADLNSLCGILVKDRPDEPANAKVGQVVSVCTRGHVAVPVSGKTACGDDVYVKIGGGSEGTFSNQGGTNLKKLEHARFLTDSASMGSKNAAVIEFDFTALKMGS